ncbi:MAG: ankyrin repeat domain-containing protein [Sphingobacteriaceae bacterium]|nr:MAG: ankyrin repeat domain-containing protein [Sphingobacteriaceae bacterium]
MKKLLIAVFAIVSLSANAQQNTLLDQSFWQKKPDVEAVKAEIAKGASHTQSNASGFDPVVLAINASAPTETIKYMLSQPGTDINKLTHDGRNYIHWASSRGNAEVVEYLLSKKAKTDTEDTHGSTPFLFALNGGQQNIKVFDLFLAHGLDIKKEVNADGANALLLAVGNDKDFVLSNYFISKGLDWNSVDAAGNNAFAYAARTGNIDLLKALLEKGVKPSPNAMLMAAQGGARRGGPTPTISPLAIYEYLESLNIKPTVIAKNGENVLHAIVRKPNQAELVQYFLSKGVDVNQADEEGNSVLMAAASTNRDLPVYEMLLLKVKNINQANNKGVTALALAVGSNSPAIVNYLISKGADVKALDKKGNNVAYYLIENYRAPMAMRGPGGPVGPPAAQPATDDFDAKLAILTEKGLDFTAPQKDGNTFYHLAVAKNNLALVKRLQPLGIDINLKNKEGFTALHKAALIAKDDVMMQYLISAGAKKDITTNFNETAFDLATENEALTKNKVSVNFLK